MRSGKKVFLIDGTAYCYRAFHALPELSTADGRPTNAVYGFAVMLQALREKERPDYLAVAFDVGKPTFRHRAYEAYKAKRPPMPDALIAQIPVIKALLRAYQVPAFELEGYEGEDVLATITKQIAHAGVEVFLVTGDKDALQLVNSHVKVYNPHQDGVVLDAAAVQRRYGVRPEQMVDFMALMGDHTDQIPGVRGIGEKTAAELLQRFGSLEQLYARLDEVESAAQRQRLADGREDATLSQMLARIDCAIPVDANLQDLTVQEPDWKALRRMFRDLEFKRLLTAVETNEPPQPRSPLEIRTAGDDAALTVALRILTNASSPVAVTCLPDDVSGETVRLILAARPDQAWLIPVTPARFKEAAGRRLAAWLADAGQGKIGHDVKVLSRRLAALGVALQGIEGDTLLAAYLLNPARSNQRLSDLVDEHLDERLPSLPPVAGAAGLEAPEVLEVGGQHACAILRLHERLAPALRERDLESLYREVELPLIPVLAQMEQTGVAIDLPYLKRLRASMEARLARLTEELYELAGTTFNLNSPKQLAQVLFERLGLPVVKRTKTGPSTDADVLRQLAPQHPLPQRLLEYRELAKLLSTYVEALPKLVDASTGRIHTSFNQAATATGRLSSSDPNLQNIPVKTEMGRQVRKAFIPTARRGVLVAVDYSQIELRILAHLSGDPALTEAFHKGRDIHCFTASLIHGIPEDEVQPEQRSAMKAINYGIVYGMSAHGLAKELGLPYAEAEAFIEMYFERYPKVRTYLDAQIDQARTSGYVQTLLGRRRYIPELRSKDPTVRSFGERMAVNAPVQGSAADLMKRAMLAVSSRLQAKRLASRMILQVHDELLFDAPHEEERVLIELVRPIMERALALSVPLTVTVKTGPNWLDLKEISG